MKNLKNPKQRKIIKHRKNQIRGILLPRTDRHTIDGTSTEHNMIKTDK